MLLCTVATNPFVHGSTSHFSRPAPVTSSRERYLRSLEVERQKNVAGPSTSNSSQDVEFLSVWEQSPRPQTDFIETVRQRQERLEGLRRQNFAQRLALNGLRSPAASEYAMKRLPHPLRPNAGQRALAATKIQRTFRDHLQMHQSQAAIVSISSSFVSLRRSNVSRKGHQRNSSLSPLYPSRPLSIHDYEGRMKALLAQLEEVMTSIHPSVRPSGQRLSLEFRKELEKLEVAEMYMGMKKLRVKNTEILSHTIEEDKPKIVERTSTFPSHRTCSRMRSRTPSLDTIAEE